MTATNLGPAVTQTVNQAPGLDVTWTDPTGTALTKPDGTALNVTSAATGADLASKLPNASNQADSLKLLDNFTRASIPLSGSPIVGSLPDVLGSTAWTATGAGFPTYSARVVSNGVVGLYRASDNVQLSPFPADSNLYIRQVASATPVEAGHSFSFPTFSGNTSPPSVVMAVSADADPPNNNMFHITFSSSANGGGNNGSITFNIWDWLRGYVGSSLTPSVITTGTGFSGTATTLPVNAGQAYRLRAVFKPPWVFVTIDGVGSAWGYYDRMANIIGPNMYVQFIPNQTSSYSSFWSRGAYSQNSGTYATFPAGLDNTPIGEAFPASIRATSLYVDRTAGLVPVASTFAVESSCAPGDAALSLAPTFQAPTGDGKVRFAAPPTFNYRLSFCGIGNPTSFEPTIESSVNTGNVRLRSADGAELGVTHSAFATNGSRAYTTVAGFAFNSPTGPVYEVGTGVPAITRADGSIFVRTDSPAAGSRLYIRISGAWVAATGV